MTRSVFYGFGAFVGSITGPTTCSFWPDDPGNLGWDPAKRIAVDLSKNPESARRGTIAAADIQVDDFAGYGTGGSTKIGPLFPGGSVIGLAFLSDSYLATLGASRPAHPPPGFQGRSYELCSIVYWNTLLAGRRFLGFYAEIKGNQNNLTLVSVWARGTSQVPNQAPMGTWWIDLSENAHPVEQGVTEISVAGVQSGALFLDHQTGGGGVIPFDSPKVPRSAGGALARTVHRDR